MDQPTNPTNDPVADFLANRAGLCREAQVEHAAVGRILKAAGIKKSTAQTFKDLVDMGFPLRLVVAAVPKRERATLIKDIMSRPTKTRLYAAYEDAFADCPDAEGMLGIVVPWYGGLYVWHDWGITRLGTAGFYTKIYNKYFYFETLGSLMSRLGPYEEW
jgi:hypothetical protein